MSIEQEGLYMVTAINECGFAMDSIRVIEGSAGIFSHNAGLHNITIQPNPTNGNFILQSINPIHGQLSVCLFDLLGNLIFESVVSADGQDSFYYSLPIQQNGIFVLQIKNSDENVTIKLVVQ